MPSIKKYTVKVTKEDGAKSQYFVLAASAGGAETVCLRQVYSAKYAVAKKGWPSSVKVPDLFSDGAARAAISFCLRKGGKVA